jgi:hypothetical protein
MTKNSENMAECDILIIETRKAGQESTAGNTGQAAA